MPMTNEVRRTERAFLSEMLFRSVWPAILVLVGVVGLVGFGQIVSLIGG